VASLALALRAIGETLAISVPTVTDSLFRRVTMERCDARLRRWAKRLLDQAEAQRSVRGLDALATDEVFVVMSNHRSLYDVPLLIESFPRTLRMVTKAELFRVPIWGAAMRNAGFIEVDRRNEARARAAMELAKARLTQGINVWIAPEGTRSRTGELGPFKSGGFHLALGTGLRILPVGIRGTEKILAADGLRVTRGAQVAIAFGQPIDPAIYGLSGRHALRDRVREAVLEQMALA
jgi:1-acyl-sn-glycerol-3-phosphate acyltransferase